MICELCAASERDAVDELLARGRTPKEVAEELGLAEADIAAHCKHLSRGLRASRKAALARRLENGDKAVRRERAATQMTPLEKSTAKTEEGQLKARELMVAAQDGGDLRTAVSGLREYRGWVELEANLHGLLRDSQGNAVQVNIQLGAEQAQTIEALLKRRETIDDDA